VYIEELMRAKLVELGKYPVHTEVFAEKWYNTQKAIIDSLNYSTGGETNGTGVGSNPVTFNSSDATQNRENARTELISRGVSPAEADKMLDQAEQEANKNQGILGKDNSATQQLAQSEADKRTQENQVKYNDVFNYAYNWYSQYGDGRGTPSLEGSYLANTTSIDKNDTSGKVRVCDAYADGKAAGIAKYNQDLINRANNGDKNAENEARNKGLISGGDTVINPGLSDYIQPGSIGTNGNGTTIQDVINQNNSQNTNQNNGPVVTNPGVTVSPPEETDQNNQNDQDNQNNATTELPEGFVPIVDDTNTAGGDTIIWSEEDILNQIEQIMQQEDAQMSTKAVTTSSYKVQASDAVIEQAITEVAQEAAQTADTYEGGEMRIDPSLLEYVTFDDEGTVYTK
ncbi:MAG: hypothetical protein K2I72_03050, partial [Bacilli bacterium]|nr:hypothetical protein [Bacilli bacterium]